LRKAFLKKNLLGFLLSAAFVLGAAWMTADAKPKTATNISKPAEQTQRYAATDKKSKPKLKATKGSKKLLKKKSRRKSIRQTSKAPPEEIDGESGSDWTFWALIGGGLMLLSGAYLGFKKLTQPKTIWVSDFDDSATMAQKRFYDQGQEQRAYDEMSVVEKKPTPPGILDKIKDVATKITDKVESDPKDDKQDKNAA
jgi:hypothetical protein